MDKELLRKITGVPEPTGPSDPSVLARRKTHIELAKWCIKWRPTVLLLSCIFGVVFIVLPAISASWRSVIEKIPPLAVIFYSYASLKGALFWVHFLLIMGMSTLLNFFDKYKPGGIWVHITLSEIVEMELYPRTKKEEFAYWLVFLYGVVGGTLVLMFPCGLFAYFVFPASYVAGEVL